MFYFKRILFSALLTRYLSEQNIRWIKYFQSKTRSWTTQNILMSQFKVRFKLFLRYFPHLLTRYPRAKDKNKRPVIMKTDLKLSHIFMLTFYISKGIYFSRIEKEL